MKYFKKKVQKDKKQAGSVQIFIILVVILIAFLLAGGEFLLGSAFPLPDSLGIGSGGGTPADGGSGGSTNGIAIQNKGCIGSGTTAKSATTIIVTGEKAGYISLEISNGAGGFATIETHEFKNIPTSVYEINLPNQLGFNTSPWRVRLFEGGTQTNGNFTGGTEKEVKDFPATNC